MQKPTIDKRLIWLALILLIVKLSLLPFAQSTDSDAATRTWLGMMWLHHPEWITHGTWGPVHFYITGIALAIWNNPVYAPVVLNILFSVAMLFPFYFFVKREFNPNGAFIAACLLAISPIMFRYSMMNMSETPYFFLLILMLNYLSRGFHTNKASDFLLAGLFATIGSGIRFEFWIFIFFLVFIIFFKAGMKSALLFIATAMLYPFTDIVTHFIMDGYSLKEFFHHYPWTMHVNQGAPQFVDYLRRLWFLPLCWLIALGPAAFIAIRELATSRKHHQSVAWCALLFLIFFLITEINALSGTIFLHTRFSSTIAILGIPFIAPWFNELSKPKIRTAAILLILTVGLSYIYNVGNISPLPRLSDQTGDKVAKLVCNQINPASGLVVDFWEWENTYYLALQTKLGLDNLHVQEELMMDSTRRADINRIINAYKEGVILLVKNSPLWQESEITNATFKFKFNDHLLSSKLIFENSEIGVWQYTWQ